MAQQRQLKAVVLAAGQGKRLRSEEAELPKVLRLANGRALLDYVLEAIDFIDPQDTLIVVGYRRDQVMERYPEYGFAVQEQQLGTGHAVMSALDVLGDYEGDLLVCCGDMPLLKRETYLELWRNHLGEDGAVTILSGDTGEKLSYGRIVRGEDGGFLKIVEDRDCTEEERTITELNSGVYLFRAPELRRAAALLGRSNEQNEYYLTDTPELMLGMGESVAVCKLPLGTELLGVNTQEQLDEVERLLSAT